MSASTLGSNAKSMNRLSVILSPRNVSSHYFSDLEQQVFVTMINAELSNDVDVKEYLPIDPNDAKQLQTAVQPGILLCKFMSYWIPGSVNCSQVKLHVKNKFDMLENHNILMTAAKSVGCQFSTTLQASEILEAEPHTLQAIIWQILQAGIIKKIDRAILLLQMPARCLTWKQHQKVLYFLNYMLKQQTPDNTRVIRNFSSDVADSVAYIHTLHYLVPEKCSLDILQNHNLVERAAYVSKVASEMGLVPFLASPDLIVEGNQKLNFLFSALIFVRAYHYLSKRPLDEVTTSSQQLIESIQTESETGLEATGTTNSDVDIVFEKLCHWEEQLESKERLILAREAAVARLEQSLLQVNYSSPFAAARRSDSASPRLSLAIADRPRAASLNNRDEEVFTCSVCKRNGLRTTTSNLSNEERLARRHSVSQPSSLHISTDFNLSKSSEKVLTFKEEREEIKQNLLHDYNNNNNNNNNNNSNTTDDTDTNNNEKSNENNTASNIDSVSSNNDESVNGENNGAIDKSSVSLREKFQRRNSAADVHPQLSKRKMKKTTSQMGIGAEIGVLSPRKSRRKSSRAEESVTHVDTPSTLAPSSTATPTSSPDPSRKISFGKPKTKANKTKTNLSKSNSSDGAHLLAVKSSSESKLIQSNIVEIDREILIDIQTLLNSVIQQNQQLRSQVDQLKEQFSEVENWQQLNKQRKQAEKILRSDIPVAELIIDCWQMADERDRMSNRLEECRTELQQVKKQMNQLGTLNDNLEQQVCSTLTENNRLKTTVDVQDQLLDDFKRQLMKSRSPKRNTFTKVRSHIASERFTKDNSTEKPSHLRKSESYVPGKRIDS